MINNEKFLIQEDEYVFPYHHLVEFDSFSNIKVLNWGFEYYAYNKVILDILKKNQFSSLLDIGCGEGKLIKEIAKDKNNLNKKILGIDMSARAVLYAKAFNYGNDVIFEKCDLKEVKEKFDVILLVQVLEHIPDQEIDVLVKNIYERLNDDGIFIVAVPTKNFLLLKKHYRHYDLEMLTETFKPFCLKENHYVIKNGILYKLFLKLFGSFIGWNIFRKFIFSLASSFLFNANENNGRHLICVFKKI